MHTACILLRTLSLPPSLAPSLISWCGVSLSLSLCVALRITGVALYKKEKKVAHVRAVPGVDVKSVGQADYTRAMAEKDAALLGDGDAAGAGAGAGAGWVEGEDYDP